MSDLSTLVPDRMNLTRGMVWAGVATATMAAVLIDTSVVAGAINAPSDTDNSRERTRRSVVGLVLIASVSVLTAWPWIANAVLFGGDTDIQLECRRILAGSFPHRSYLPPVLFCELPAGSGRMTSATPLSTSIALSSALLVAFGCSVAAAIVLSRQPPSPTAQR
jgi:hypothetical protein